MQRKKKFNVHQMQYLYSVYRQKYISSSEYRTEQIDKHKKKQEKHIIKVLINGIKFQFSIDEENNLINYRCNFILFSKQFVETALFFIHFISFLLLVVPIIICVVAFFLLVSILGFTTS